MPGTHCPANEVVRKMARRPRDQTFTLRDVVRAIKAAKTAGILHPRVEINRHGTISIISGEAPRDNANPLDQWMSSRADQTEGH